MKATHFSSTATFVRLLSGGGAPLRQGLGQMLGCLAAMTAGLWLDFCRVGYAGFSLCSSDPSLGHRLALHIALFPVSCLAMYGSASLALCGAMDRRRACGIAGSAMLITAQIVAGAVVMDAPALVLVGDAFLRAWLGMALVMAVAHAGRCGVVHIDFFTRGNGHEGS